MKKIVLLSDTHGYLDQPILKYCRLADEIWHAGDWGPGVSEQLESLHKLIRGVYGNIDNQSLRLVYPEWNLFQCEGLRIAMKHIGGFPGHYAGGVKSYLIQNTPDLFISGHSHILRVMRDPGINNLLHINPGAAGVHGFHKVRTLVLFKIDSGRIFDLQVVELGQRSKLLPDEQVDASDYSNHNTPK